MVVCISDFVSQALIDANGAIANEPAGKRSRDLVLMNERAAIMERFASNIRNNFDGLTVVVSKQLNVLDYGSLSLVEEADLEAIIAMEGMIAHARNCDISEYLSFTARLDSLFFGLRIDESNNPMDPEQLGEAFREALRPLGLTAVELLISYRKFNIFVFHNLEKILSQANGVLIEHDVLPNLDMAARSRAEQKNKRSARPTRVDPTDRAFATDSSVKSTSQGEDPQLLSIMQKLLRSMPSQVASGEMSGGQSASGSNVPASDMMIGKQKLEVVATEQLLGLLNKLQATSAAAEAQPQNLSESLDSLLEQEGSPDTLRAIESQSADIINLVTILYEEIWNDVTVPIPVKELVGRTQITILKIALTDRTFFDLADHPGRAFLNEIAASGISWTGTDKLDNDPIYAKMQEMVRRVVREFTGDLTVIEDLLDEFKAFKDEHVPANERAERQLSNEDERRNRLTDIEEYTQHKIEERILDKSIDPYVKEFLHTHFHKFVVQVVLREGPGGISWRPIMNTIDVLLWTVSPEKQEDDLQRFNKVNPRLILNLGKALEVAGIEKTEADEAIRALQEVQKACFKGPVSVSDSESQVAGDDSLGADTESAIDESKRHPVDAEYLQQVSNFPLGIWLEFQIAGELSIRGTLAAKIDTIEKYVFVNAQGVKVVEKSRTGLARELKAGTVKVICVAPLMDRAMESVIARLRAAMED